MIPVSKTYLATPEGDITDSFDTQLRRLHNILQVQEKKRHKKASMKAVDLIDKYVVKYGAEAAKYMSYVMTNSRMIVGEEQGALMAKLDQEFDPTMRLAISKLGRKEIDIVNAYISALYSGFNRKHISCPSFFCYEERYVPLSNLEKLLREESYRMHEERQDSVRSSNAHLKSTDCAHKINASYNLREDKNKFLVEIKYVAFGLSDGTERDKFDIVYRLTEGNASGKLLHLEHHVPVGGIINALALKRTMDEGRIGRTNPVLRKIDDFGASLMGAKLKQEGDCRLEIKTNRDDGAFVETINCDKTNTFVMDHSDLKDNFFDFNELSKDPFLAGGYVFEQIVNQARDNMPRLKEIYHKVMTGQEQK